MEYKPKSVCALVERMVLYNAYQQLEAQVLAVNTDEGSEHVTLMVAPRQRSLGSRLHGTRPFFVEMAASDGRAGQRGPGGIRVRASKLSERAEIGRRGGSCQFADRSRRHGSCQNPVGAFGGGR